MNKKMHLIFQCIQTHLFAAEKDVKSNTWRGRESLRSHCPRCGSEIFFSPLHPSSRITENRTLENVKVHI